MASGVKRIAWYITQSLGVRTSRWGVALRVGNRSRGIENFELAARLVRDNGK